MSKHPHNVKGASGSDICNPESLVSRAAVRRLVQSEQLKYAQVHACHCAGNKRFSREFAEIAASKLVMLADMSNAVAALPEVAPDLMGEKPISSELAKDAVSFRKSARHFAARTFDPNEARPDFCEEQWNRLDAVACYLDSLLSKFPGNAAEQPGPREESPQPIGNPPVTVAGANPPLPSDFHRWISRLLTSEVALLSEVALEELEARGGGLSWDTAQTSLAGL